MRLLCRQCGEGKEPGRRIALDATPEEPAEWERIVRGKAKPPTKENHYLSVGGDRYELPLDHYICDRCNGDIRPGDDAVAVTWWQEGRPEPVPWETKFLETT